MSGLIIAASVTASLLADGAEPEAPLFRKCFLSLGDESDAAAWKRAHDKARTSLLYRTMMCANHQFVKCGVCSYEFQRGKRIHRCRYAHSEQERRRAPTPDDLDHEARKMLETTYMA